MVSRRRFDADSPVEFDPEEMSRRGRIGAYAKLAKHDPREATTAARAAFANKFLREVDPEGILPLEERHRRASNAQHAHMLSLSRLSSIKRARQKDDRAKTTSDPPP